MTNSFFDTKCIDFIEDIVDTPLSPVDTFRNMLATGSGPNLRYNLYNCKFSYEDFKMVIDNIMVHARAASVNIKNNFEILIDIKSDEPFFSANEIKYTVKSVLSFFQKYITSASQSMNVVTQVENSIIPFSEIRQMLQDCNIAVGYKNGDVHSTVFNVRSGSESSCIAAEDIAISYGPYSSLIILGGISLAATGFMFYKHYIHPKVFKNHDVAPSTSVDENVLTEILGSENGFQHIDEGL